MTLKKVIQILWYLLACVTPYGYPEGVGDCRNTPRAIYPGPDLWEVYKLKMRTFVWAGGFCIVLFFRIAWKHIIHLSSYNQQQPEETSRYGDCVVQFLWSHIHSVW